MTDQANYFYIKAVNVIFDTSFSDFEAAHAHVKLYDYKAVGKVTQLACLFSDIFLEGAQHALNELKKC